MMKQLCLIQTGPRRVLSLGAVVIDAVPENLTLSVLNERLSIKHRALL